MYTQKIANIFDHIKDHSRLGLENKFLENKLNHANFFLRSTGLLYKFLPTNLGVFKPSFIIFIHYIWGETVVFIIQSLDRMRYFTILQYKLHSVNIQDEPNRTKISENFQNHPYGQLFSFL